MKHFIYINFLFFNIIGSMHGQVPPKLTNLKCWLIADSAKVSSSLIDSLIDQSGNQNHAYQHQLLKKSLQSSSLITNNHNKFTLDGVDDYLLIDDANSIDFDTTFSINIIFKPNTLNLASKTLFAKWDVGTLTGAYLFQTSDPQYYELENYVLTSVADPGGNYNKTQGLNLTDSLFLMLTVNYDGKKTLPVQRLKTFKNGVLLNSNLNGTMPQSLLSSPSPFTIGSFGNTVGRYFNADFLEILIYNKNLDSLDTKNLFNYIENKYAPNVNLGPDISIVNSYCDTTLSSSFYFRNYYWSTGETTPTISAKKSGKYWVKATNIFGEISSDTIIVTFPTYNIPTQNFICLNDSLIWDVQLPNSNYTFLWQNMSTTDSIFSIKQAGDYYVKINDLFGCSIMSDTVNISIDNFQSQVSLGPDLDSLCSGNTIFLTTGANAAISYTWSDGSTNDSLLIITSGQYSAVVTNTNNCVAKDTINITIVGSVPVANFSATIGCFNVPVSFTDLSIPPSGNTIFSHNWNFGDPASAGSNTSTVSNPFHTFSDTGNYIINLHIITNAGCEQSITKTIHIAPTPTVNFISGLSCKNDATSFLNQSVGSPGYSITSISWNFGDPGPSNTSSSQAPTHTFTNQATYTVTLGGTNSAGCTASKSNPVFVKPQVSANFTYSTPCTNTTTVFHDNSIAPASSSYSWNFGNGNTGSGLTVPKTYTNSGVYSVTLTVQSFDGCISKITKAVTIFLPPIASFTVPSFCLKDTITVTNSSVAQSGVISSYSWKLNNTQFSSIQNPTLTSASAGTYSVRLTVANSFGCKDSVTKPVTVFPLPNVDFTTNPSSNYYINSAINFIPSITNANSYLWNISGVTTSTVPSPTVNFNSEGSYTVSLNLRDQSGCKGSKTKTISINKRYLDMAILNVRTIKDDDGFISVEADVANYGSVPITSFNMHYQISDGGNIKETWVGTLNPNTLNVYVFSSKSASQNTDANNITCVEIEKVNGIQDENLTNNNFCNALNLDEISVSNPLPNPSDGDVTLPIVLNKDMDFTIAIYNSIGQIQYEETSYHGTAGLNFITLPTSSYARGCYIIKTIIDDKLFIQKFIEIDHK